MSHKQLNDNSIAIRETLEKEVPLTLAEIVKALTSMGIEIL